jgi:uncharacterized protein YbjT (DUF2867 family)
MRAIWPWTVSIRAGSLAGMTTHDTTSRRGGDGPVLVLGGKGGKTGRRVLERLEARGIPTRAASRSTTPAFDWNDRATWGPVLDGVGAAYIAFVPDVAIPGAAETVSAFAEQAVAAGVRRLVLLSGRGEEEAQRAEELVARTGAELTVVRCTWFSQNFSEGLFADGIRAGELALPVGDVPEPFVDVDDVADVAVAALTEDGHAGEVYELTGPQPLRFDEAVAEIAAVTGRKVALAPVPMEPYAAALREAGEPEEVVWLVGYLFTEVLDGRNALPTDGVQRALGRAPRSFAEYVRQTAATGVWNGGA